jgi:hypothetical protein
MDAMGQTELERIPVPIPIPDDAGFGFQPLVLGAAAVGFLLAGQAPGDLSPAEGAGIGLLIAIFAIWLLKSAATWAKPNDPLPLGWILRAEVTHSAFRWLLPESRQARLTSSEKLLAKPQAVEDSADELLRQAERDLFLRYCLSLLVKGQLNATERLFLIDCLGRAAGKG